MGNANVRTMVNFTKYHVIQTRAIVEQIAAAVLNSSDLARLFGEDQLDNVHLNSVHRPLVADGIAVADICPEVNDNYSEPPDSPKEAKVIDAAKMVEGVVPKPVTLQPLTHVSLEWRRQTSGEARSTLSRQTTPEGDLIAALRLQAAAVREQLQAVVESSTRLQTCVVKIGLSAGDLDTERPRACSANTNRTYSDFNINAAYSKMHH